MSEPVLGPEAHNEKRLRDLELAVAALQAGNGLDGSTLRDGSMSIRRADGSRILELGKREAGTFALTAVESDGHVLAVVGELESDHIGIAAYDSDTGGQRFRVDERGIIDPWFVGSVRDVNADFTAVTSGVFADTHEAFFPLMESQGVGLVVPIATGVGTTAEVRWRGPTGLYTGIYTVPAAASEYVTLRWLHGLSLGSTHSIFRLEVRRASGANPVNVYKPTAYLRSPEGCSILG